MVKHVPGESGSSSGNLVTHPMKVTSSTLNWTQGTGSRWISCKTQMIHSESRGAAACGTICEDACDIFKGSPTYRTSQQSSYGAMGITPLSSIVQNKDTFVLLRQRNPAATLFSSLAKINKYKLLKSEHF